jgi:hypothetical protein
LPQLDISFLSLDQHHHHQQQQQQQHTLSTTDSCTEDEDCILNLKIFDPDFSSLHSCDGQDWFVISIHSSSSPQEMISFEIINPFACHQYAALHEHFVMKCSAASQQQQQGEGEGREMMTFFSHLMLYVSIVLMFLFSSSWNLHL